MKRLTTNKPTDAMSMVELAHNSCFAKNGEAYYRDFECEISARDLARNLAWSLADIELSRDDKNFDEEMMDNLQYDILQTNIGLIALFYRNLWAMADLREQLKRYEDLGTVEELQQAMEKQTAVSRMVIEGQYFCPKCKNLMKYPGYCGCGQKLY